MDLRDCLHSIIKEVLIWFDCDFDRLTSSPRSITQGSDKLESFR